MYQCIITTARVAAMILENCICFSYIYVVYSVMKTCLFATISFCSQDLLLKSVALKGEKDFFAMGGGL